MAEIILIIFFILSVAWIGILSYYFYRLYTNYLGFTRGSNRKTLDTTLSEVAKDLSAQKRTLAHIIRRCDTMEQESKLHIQKVGLLRFNPFKDTGGDQSFIVALTDAYDTGVVITALYARSTTRWYAKRIVKGQGIEHELSDEEKRALKMAKNI